MFFTPANGTCLIIILFERRIVEMLKSFRKGLMGLTVVALICAMAMSASAATVKSDEDGTWSTPSIWDTDSVPLPEDNVWILTDVVQDVNVLGKTDRVFVNGGNLTIPFGRTLEAAQAGLITSGTGTTTIEGTVNVTKLQNWSNGQLVLKAGAVVNISTSPAFRIDSGTNNNRIIFDNESLSYDLKINATGTFLIIKGVNLKFIADPNPEYGFYELNTSLLQINNHAAMVKIEVDFNGYPVPSVGDPDITLITYDSKQIAAGNEIETAVVVENANQAFQVVDTGSSIAIRAVPTSLMVDVLGKDVDTALADIAAAGFTDVVANEQPSDTIAAGTVIGQNINGDLYVPADSPVVLTVSSGKQRGWTWVGPADPNDPNDAADVANWIANTDDSVWPPQDYDDVNDLAGDRLFISSGSPVWDSNTFHGDGLLMTGGSLTLNNVILDVAPGLLDIIDEGGYSRVGMGEPNSTKATLIIGSDAVFNPRALWIGNANAFDDTIGSGHVIVEGTGVLTSLKWIALAPDIEEDTLLVGDDVTTDPLVPSGLLEIRGSEATVETYQGWFELNSPNAEVRFVADANGFSIVKAGVDGGTRGIRIRDGLISVDFNGYQEAIEASLGGSGFIELMTFEASRDITDDGCISRSSALLPEGWSIAINPSADEFGASRKALGLQWTKPVSP